TNPVDTNFWIMSDAGTAVSSFPLLPEQPLERIPASGAVNMTDRFTVALAASPDGVGLRRDINMASVSDYSDQTVTYTVRDSASNVLGSVEVSNGPAYGTEIIEGVMWALVGAGTAAVVLAAGAGWFISR